MKKVLGCGGAESLEVECTTPGAPFLHGHQSSAHAGPPTLQTTSSAICTTGREGSQGRLLQATARRRKIFCSLTPEEELLDAEDALAKAARECLDASDA